MAGEPLALASLLFLWQVELSLLITYQPYGPPNHTLPLLTIHIFLHLHTSHTYPPSNNPTMYHHHHHPVSSFLRALVASSRRLRPRQLRHDRGKRPSRHPDRRSDLGILPLPHSRAHPLLCIRSDLLDVCRRRNHGQPLHVVPCTRLSTR